MVLLLLACAVMAAVLAVGLAVLLPMILHRHSALNPITPWQQRQHQGGGRGRGDDQAAIRLPTSTSSPTPAARDPVAKTGLRRHGVCIQQLIDHSGLGLPILYE